MTNDRFYALEDTGLKTPMGDTVWHAHDGSYTKNSVADPYFDDDTGITSASTDGTRPVYTATSWPILNAQGATGPFYYTATTYADQTATIGLSTTAAGNTAANSAIYNVSTAKVVNLNVKNVPANRVWPGISDLTTLNDAAFTAAIYNTAAKQPCVSVQLSATDPLTVEVIYVCFTQP